MLGFLFSLSKQQISSSFKGSGIPTLKGGQLLKTKSAAADGDKVECNTTSHVVPFLVKRQLRNKITN